MNKTKNKLKKIISGGDGSGGKFIKNKSTTKVCFENASSPGSKLDKVLNSIISIKSGNKRKFERTASYSEFADCFTHKFQTSKGNYEIRK